MSTTITDPMIRAIRGLPDQLLAGWDAATGLGSLEPGVKEIVVAGMGGSAFPGDILASLFCDSSVRVTVSRGYSLPMDAQVEDSLVIVSSFSGRTHEALSSLDDARRRGCLTILVTGNQGLAEEASSKGQLCVCLPTPFDGFQPRAAYGYFLGAFLRISKAADLTAPGMPDPLEALRACAQQLRDERTSQEDEGSRLARALGEQIPVFCAPYPYGESIARICKIKVNENAKSPAYWGELPEFNHNEMVGLTRNSEGLAMVFFEDEQAATTLRNRMLATQETMDALGVQRHIVTLRGANRLSRIMGALQLFDYASFFMAQQAGVEPNPVALVEDFKRRLAMMDRAAQEA